LATMTFLSAVLWHDPIIGAWWNCQVQSQLCESGAILLCRVPQQYWIRKSAVIRGREGVWIDTSSFKLEKMSKISSLLDHTVKTNHICQQRQYYRVKCATRWLSCKRVIEIFLWLCSLNRTAKGSRIYRIGQETRKKNK
jgi:hypothetical protein